MARLRRTTAGGCHLDPCRGTGVRWEGGKSEGPVGVEAFGEGGYSFVVCSSNLTIDHASLSDIDNMLRDTPPFPKNNLSFALRVQLVQNAEGHGAACQLALRRASRRLGAIASRPYYRFFPPGTRTALECLTFVSSLCRCLHTKFVQFTLIK